MLRTNVGAGCHKSRFLKTLTSRNLQTLNAYSCIVFKLRLDQRLGLDLPKKYSGRCVSYQDKLVDSPLTDVFERYLINLKFEITFLITQVHPRSSRRQDGPSSVEHVPIAHGLVPSTRRPRPCVRRFSALRTATRTISDSWS